MKKLMLATFINVLGIMIFSGCVSAVRFEDVYHGKVIDAQTGAPISGVVVLAVWDTEQATPAGATHKFYDANETVTDKNGDFSMDGKGALIMSNVIPAWFTIFKAGYTYQAGSWRAFKEGYLASKTIKWEGDKAIIPLKKLTMEDRRKEGSSPPLPPGEASIEKVILMLKEINEDAKERGADLIDSWNGGKVYEKNNTH